MIDDRRRRKNARAAAGASSSRRGGGIIVSFTRICLFNNLLSRVRICHVSNTRRAHSIDTIDQ